MRHTDANTSHKRCLLFRLTHEDLGGRVIDVDGLEDGGTIVGDRHLVTPSHALKDLVLWEMNIG